MSEPADHDRRVVAEETAVFLELEGLLSPTQNNKRKLSVSVLSSSSRSTKTSASSTFTAASIHETADQIVIPDALKSKETYAFIGFTNDMAAEIWRRFVTKPADMDEDFLDFAVSHVELHPSPDATSSTDDWHECLTALGINQQLSQAIMMHEFEDIRYTASCKFWVLESIVSNYNALASLDEELRAAQARIQSFRKTGRKHAGSVSETPSAPTPKSKKGQASSSSSAPAGPSTGAGKSAEEQQQTGRTKQEVEVEDEAPESLPGHHMIWRGCDKVQATRFCDPITQAISLSAVQMNPGDFSGKVTVGYFTPQKETADRYACWRKHKQPISEIRIVQIAVPDEFIKSLSVQDLWDEDRSRPTNEWKSLIWYSRRGEYLPAELEWLEDRDLLIGHIASGKNCKYEKVKKPEDIKDSDVLTIEKDGVQFKATQWVFRSKKAERGFQKACEGKVLVHPMGTLKVPKQSDEWSSC